MTKDLSEAQGDIKDLQGFAATVARIDERTQNTDKNVRELKDSVNTLTNALLAARDLSRAAHT